MSDIKKEKKPRTEKQLAHTAKLILMNKERAVIRNKQKAEGTYVAPIRKSKKAKAETLIIKEVPKDKDPPSLSVSLEKIKKPKKKKSPKPKTPPPPSESDASTDLEDDISDYASDASEEHAIAGHYGNEEDYYEVNQDDIAIDIPSEAEAQPQPNYTPEPKLDQKVIKPVKRRRTYHR